MAASDCVIDTVTRLQTLTGSHGKAPPDVWNHTCRQLLGLMNDYPGGVSTPVLETHLWSQSHAARASAAGQSKASTLAEMLRMSNEELQTPVSGLRVCVESVLDSTADVAAASAAPAAAAPAVQQAVSGAVPVLLLRDDSLPDGTKSVGMYVHSRLRELFCGPHAPLGPGCHLRLGNCRLRRSPKGSGLPQRLLPTTEVALVLDSLPAAAALFCQQHIFSLSQVTGSAPVAEGQQQVLTGLLSARVARVEALAEGLSNSNAHASRSGRCCSVWLADPADRGALAQGGCRGGGGLTELRLLDQQVAVANLLRPGEQMLLRFPVILGLQSSMCIQLGTETLVCVVGAAAATQPSQAAAAPGTQARRTMVSDLQPGAVRALLVGRVHALTFTQLGERKVLDLQLQDASGSLSLQMHFLGGPTQVALSLRAGHHIAVSGVLLLQQNAPVAGPLQAEWHEGLDAAELRNLTATRAALLSPVFQESGSLPSLAQAAAPQRRLLSLTLVRARLAAAPALRWERVHSACGRGLTDSMRLGGGPSVNVADDSKERYVCCGTLRKVGAGGGAQAAASRQMRQLQSSGHEQWGCAFCGAACCTQTSQMVATAMLGLEDGGSGASEVDAEASATAPLLAGVSPQEFHAWAADRQAEHLAALKGATVVASLYQLPQTTGGASALAPTASGAAADVSQKPAAAGRLGCALLRLDVTPAEQCS